MEVVYVIDEPGEEVNGKTAYLGLRVFPEVKSAWTGKRISRDDAEEDFTRVLLTTSLGRCFYEGRKAGPGVSTITCRLPIDKGRAGLWSAVSTSIRKGCPLIFTSSSQLANLHMHQKAIDVITWCM